MVDAVFAQALLVDSVIDRILGVDIGRVGGQGKTVNTAAAPETRIAAATPARIAERPLAGSNSNFGTVIVPLAIDW